jgi:hypothetical protein
MGLFSKKDRGEATLEKPPCPHSALVPRWDSVDDIGHEERATSYFCEACGESFSPAEARLLQQSMADRLPVGES